MSRHEKELLQRLMDCIDKEDGVYVINGLSRITGLSHEIEVDSDLETALDDITQYLEDGSEAEDDDD